ncbi:MAG: hypothetical protein RSA53_05415 [Odoribacter sp.]
MNIIEELTIKKYLGQRELPEHKRIPADSYIDWAQFGARENERLMKEKALKAFCKAICPNGIRCEKTSTPHPCKRVRNFVKELAKQS